MNLVAFVIWLAIGGVAGWLAGLLMRGGGFGIAGNIIVGIVGAVVAGFVFPLLGLAIGGGLVGDVIFAMMGACLLLFVVGLIKRA